MGALRIEGVDSAPAGRNTVSPSSSTRPPITPTELPDSRTGLPNVGADSEKRSALFSHSPVVVSCRSSSCPVIRMRCGHRSRSFCF